MEAGTGALAADEILLELNAKNLGKIIAKYGRLGINLGANLCSVPPL